MSQKEDFKYWESFFQSLQMTYYGLLAAPLFLFAVAFLRAENGNAKLLAIPADIEDTIVGITVILAIIETVFLHFLAKRQYKLAAQDDVLVSKMKKYKSATLIKYIGLAIYQIITVAVFAMTYHNGLMGLFTGLLLYSSFFRPEIQNARRDLKLSKEEYQKIDYKTGLVT
ncbi:hypothetical protein MATR_27710 [Marivirga tractuosa]|uniref:Transmembrane protein n=1 Tax=Marivirga tractuosa (strain ATCC 23168 / DSM 4126 / NBRC 15989 / NCIMB 1408 / VKM B-1430 / H-43) TaxID=643867 RepID=E4TLV0_MARTH|nr:hypothetical protein [Marivirga tractuosa]ADR23379.1 hypothetical protein Ftrac_3405 [Marivirga tractuosa DSM 4126]BDD15946.1 hypothetical protein MATR_27710 [Marivirga tractuosa]